MVFVVNSVHKFKNKTVILHYGISFKFPIA